MHSCKKKKKRCRIYQSRLERKEGKRSDAFFVPRDLHRNTRSAVGHVVREINEKLCKAALRGCVIAEDGGEGGIPEWFGKTLTQGLPGSAVVTQAGNS